MKLLFTITFWTELAFAHMFVISPSVLFRLMDVEGDPAKEALARLFGTALLGFVVLLRFARKGDSAELHRATLIALLVYWVISLGLLIWAQIAGVFAPTGWGVVVLHLGFSVAYGYFVFRKKR